MACARAGLLQNYEGPAFGERAAQTFFTTYRFTLKNELRSVAEQGEGSCIASLLCTFLREVRHQGHRVMVWP